MTIQSGTYRIVCVFSAGQYIGSTNDFERRWYEHRRELDRYDHANYKLQDLWADFGEESFEFSIVELVEDHSKLFEREQYYLDILEPELNIALYAEGPSRGLVRSEESRQRSSKALKLAHARHTPEQKAQIAENIRLGRKRWYDSLAPEEQIEFNKSLSHPHSEETKRILSIKSTLNNPRSMLGKTHSPETRLKLSAAAKGRKPPPITDAERQRRREFMTGRKLSPETIQKLVDSHKGKKLTEEHKQKLRDAHKGRPGRPTSDETKEKLRQIALAQKSDPEYLRKHDEGLRAAMNTPEMHEKLSKAHKGKTLSAEHKEKIRLANIGKHSKPRAKRKQNQGK